MKFRPPDVLCRWEVTKSLAASGFPVLPTMHVLKGDWGSESSSGAVGMLHAASGASSAASQQLAASTSDQPAEAASPAVEGKRKRRTSSKSKAAADEAAALATQVKLTFSPSQLYTLAAFPPQCLTAASSLDTKLLSFCRPHQPSHHQWGRARPCPWTALASCPWPHPADGQPSSTRMRMTAT